MPALIGAMTLARIVAYICLPIMIHRLRLTEEVITSDMSMLKAYSTFGAKCGDSLAKLNVEVIKSDLNEADMMVTSCLYFSGLCLLWYILEALSLIMCIVPVKTISKDTLTENLKSFFGCTEFATYMSVSVLRS